MRHQVLKLIFVFCALMGLSPCRSVNTDVSDPSGLDREIAAVFENLKMTGLGIAVVKGDSIVCQKSLGYRVIPDSNNKGDLLQNDDLFSIASVSKTFIATTILRLVEERKCGLNDDAQKYLNFNLRNPAFPSTPITLKQLLTHTSGLNDDYGWWNIDYINPEIDKDYYKRYSDYRPGTHYQYCNLNYTILGAVIENITKERFDKVVDKYIMAPLGLKGGFNQNVLDSTKFVNLYTRDKDTGEIGLNNYTYKRYSILNPENYRLGKNLSLEYPAAGMKISSGDLARYMMMHMNWGQYEGKRIISKKSEKSMQRNYVGSGNYGLSYRQYRDLVDGKVLHGQTGGGGGIKTCMIFNPEDRYGFVILSAGADSGYIDGYGDIHKPLIKILYNHLIKDAD